MIYTRNNVQFLGGDETKAAGKSDIAGAVSSGFSAAGDIFKSFFEMKTEEIKASTTDPNRTAATFDKPDNGMSKNTKTALIIGGGVTAAALLLVVAMR